MRGSKVAAGLLSAVMALGVALGGCAKDQDSWPRIESSGVLRIGVDPTFPPFALAEGDEVSGIDIELGRALATELGLQPQFVFFGYDGLYDALATNQVDVLISALVMAPERTRDAAYSSSYFDAGQFLVVPATSDAIRNADDLSGRVVAVELGALGHVEALARQEQQPDILIRTYGSAEEALLAVAGGEADAALVDSVSARLFLKPRGVEEPGLLLLPTPVAPEPYAMAVRIEDKTLLRRLNEALFTLGHDGRLDAIVQKWLGS